MATTTRAFSLSLGVQARLERLSAGARKHLVRTYLVPGPSATQRAPTPVPPLDDAGILPEEYPDLLVLMQYAAPVKSYAEFKSVVEARAANVPGLDVFNTALRKARVRSRRVVRQIERANARLNRKAFAHAPILSQSRIVDALLDLAITTLEERAAVSARE